MISISRDPHNLGFVLVELSINRRLRFSFLPLFNEEGEAAYIAARIIPPLIDWDRVVAARARGEIVSFRPLTLLLLYRFFSTHVLGTREGLSSIPGYTLRDGDGQNLQYQNLTKEEIKQLSLSV